MTWGNSSGCAGAGRRSRKSFNAAPNDGRAVVNTSADWPGSSEAAAGAGTLRSTKRQPTPPARTTTQAASRRTNADRDTPLLLRGGGSRLRGGGSRRRFGPERADEVDD